MTKVVEGITTSLDGYITGPNADAGFTFVDGLEEAMAAGRLRW